MKGILKRYEKLGPYLWCLPAFIFLYLNQIKFWTDSELWPVTATRYFLHGKEGYLFSIKPVFHFLLFLNSVFSAVVELHPMVTARLVFGINALVILILGDQWLQTKRVEVRWRIFFPLLLLSCSLWVFRGGEVRSDILATSIFLAALLVPRRSPWLAVCFVFSLLVTAKVFFWWLAALPILWPNHGIGIRWNRKFIFIGLVLILFFVFTPQIRESLSFFLKSFEGRQREFQFWSWARLEHIVRMIVQNPHIFLLWAVGLYLAWRRKSAEGLSLFLFTLLIFLFPDPLPFFLVALLPILILLTLKLLSEAKMLKTWTEKKWIALAATLLGLFVFRAGELSRHNNGLQRMVAENLKNQVGEKSVLVFDPAGIVPTGSVEYWFLGPAMADYMKGMAEFIKNQNVDLIIVTGKMSYLEPYLGDYLSTNYIKFGESLLVRAVPFEEFEELKTCEEKLVFLRARFPLQINNTAPIFFREFDEVNDRSQEIFYLDPQICAFKRDQSTPNLRSVWMPMNLWDVPKENLAQLFSYDANF